MANFVVLTTFFQDGKRKEYETIFLFSGGCWTLGELTTKESISLSSLNLLQMTKINHGQGYNIDVAEHHTTPSY